jgi:hypothetical protein
MNVLNAKSMALRNGCILTCVHGEIPTFECFIDILLVLYCTYWWSCHECDESKWYGIKEGCIRICVHGGMPAIICFTDILHVCGLTM